GKRRFVVQVVGLGKSGGPDGVRGLVRSPEIAGKPYRIARQDLSDSLEHDTVRRIAADIGLPVNTPAIVAYRRVSHPPPPRRDNAGGNGMLRDERGGFIGHRENPLLVLLFVKLTLSYVKPYGVSSGCRLFVARVWNLV